MTKTTRNDRSLEPSCRLLPSMPLCAAAFDRLATDDPPHRGIAPETVGVVHILVSGEASIDRLAKQTDDAMPAVLARPAVGQDMARQCGQPPGIVEFTISE